MYIRTCMCIYFVSMAQVPEFTSQVFGNSVEIQWNFGLGIPQILCCSIDNAMCHHHLHTVNYSAPWMRNHKTCPIPYLETDSNSSVMLFSGTHLHTKICRRVASSGHQTKTTSQTQFHFDSNRKPSPSRTRLPGDTFCGRHAWPSSNYLLMLHLLQFDRAKIQALTLSCLRSTVVWDPQRRRRKVVVKVY